MIKRVSIGIIIFLVAIVLVIGTGIGRRVVIIPIANSLLKQKIPNHNIEIKKLSLGTSSLKSFIVVDKTIGVIVEGPVQWLSQEFDLMYKVVAKKVEIDGKFVPLGLNIRGRLSGESNNMKVSGKGILLDAQAYYRFGLVEGVVKGIEAIVKGADVSQLLSLAKQPNYASGKLNLAVMLPLLDTSNLSSGKVAFRIYQGKLNKELLKRDFNIDLPKNDYDLKANIKLKKGLLDGKAKLSSSLGTLELKRFKTNTSFKIIKTDYRLSLPNLARVGNLSPIPLSGAMFVSGRVYFNIPKNRLQIGGTTTSFGGTTRFFYDSDRLKVKINGLRLARVMQIIKEPNYTKNSSIDGKITLASVQKLNGTFNFYGKGELDSDYIKRHNGIDLSDLKRFKFGIDGKMANMNIKALANLELGAIKLKATDITYSTIAGALQSNYKLVITNLSKLSKVANIPLSGTLGVDGKIAYLSPRDYFRIDGKSKSFGGDTNFIYQNDKLTLTLKGNDPNQWARRLAQPQLFNKSLMNLELKMDSISAQMGTLSLSLGGYLDTAVIKREFNTNLGKRFSYRLNSKGRLSAGEFMANAKLDTSMAKIDFKKLIIDLQSSTLDGDYKLLIPDLKKLQPLTTKTYRGKMDIDGKIQYKNALAINGHSKAWGGRVDFLLKDGSKLQAKMGGIKWEELMFTLGYPKLLSATSEGDIDYDISKSKGNVKFTLDSMSFIKSDLTMVIGTLLNYDLTNEFFQRAVFTSNIVKNKNYFDFRVESDRLKITINRGVIDTLKDKIDAIVVVDAGDKIYKVKLKGKISHPKITPILTDALKNKVEKEAGKLIQKTKLPDEIKNTLPKILPGMLPSDNKQQPASTVPLF